MLISKVRGEIQMLWPSTFGNGITYVVALRSKKQMVWPNTRRIVTAMQNARIFWYGTEVEFPRNSMGIYSNPISSQMAVAKACPSTNPFPTAICLSDFGPEVFLCPPRRRLVDSWIAPSSPSVVVAPTPTTPDNKPIAVFD